MKKLNVDLHTQTNYSLNGTKDPNWIINKAKEEGFKYLSFTDHNTVEAYHDVDLNDLDIKLVTGVEIDVNAQGTSLDLLCYDFDVAMVDEYTKTTYMSIKERQQIIYNKLIELCHKKGVELEDIPFNPDEWFAHAAVFHQLAPKNPELLEEYNMEIYGDFYRLSTTEADFPLYLNLSFIWPSIEEAVKVYKEAGAKVFIGSPHQYKASVSTILDLCKDYIDGIEITNAKNTKEQTKELIDYAKANNLLMVSGSDFQGTKDRNELGAKVPEDITEDDIIGWLK